MRTRSWLVLTLLAAPALAADLDRIPPNTWVELKYATQQPADSRDRGQLTPAGWNKLVWDSDQRRVLFYDRWHDKRHGGATIYGNCLFAFDPAADKLRPLRIDNWTKNDTPQGGYRTVALPENDREPTPCPRHVYHAFDHAPELKAVFICNGANQSAMQGDRLLGHDLCDGAWRLDLATGKWHRLGTEGQPPNTLDDAMVWCPATRSLVYAGQMRQLWIYDLAAGKWRKARQSPPARVAFGQTLVYDPDRQRILIVGGGRLDGWMRGEAKELRELYAFDPRSESVERLADCPTALYASHLAYDRKRQLFVAVAVFNKQEQPSGMYCYDPRKNAWHAIRPANPIPPHRGWFGWMKLCHSPEYDCFLGMIGDTFHAFRYIPEGR